MELYVSTEDLYRFKLALILGRGKRLDNILKKYPTEKKFKDASLKEIAQVIGIKNLNSRTLTKLKNLDYTYDQMVTFRSNSTWSNLPRAKKIMGIDTEYLKSDLDTIQYVILDHLKPVTSGFIFTNEQLAPSVSIEQGINILRNVIQENNPDLIVGHNFNSDISILETAYGDPLPELHFYDDTMDLMEQSQLANIVGGSGLNKVVEKVFSEKTIGLFSAYKDLKLLMEYGIKDAVYPILLREYILSGEIPQVDWKLSIDRVVCEENRSLLDKDHLKFSLN
ncbi:MAG: hypothetical protein ACOCQ1_01770 [Halanaerobiaceae bacterium]